MKNNKYCSIVFYIYTLHYIYIYIYIYVYIYIYIYIYILLREYLGSKLVFKQVIIQDFLPYFWSSSGVVLF